MSKYNYGNLSKEDIIEMITDTFPDLKFRKYQRAVIINILLKYDKDPKSKIIVDAPTGAGKSIIAMVVAKVLNKHFKKTGYIITSDTYLQDQYEESIEQLYLDMPSVKGLDRYFCDVNLMSISLGQCKIDRLSSDERRNLDCYNTCPYYSVRDRAIQQPTAVLNYNYWIIQQYENHQAKQNDKEAKSLFENRDFVIFDEAHKVVNIVNNFFSPMLIRKLTEDVDGVMEWLMSYNKIKPNERTDNLENISLILERLINDLSENEFKDLSALKRCLDVILKMEEFINNQFDTFKTSNIKLSSTDYKVLKNFKNIQDVYNKVSEYLSLVESDPEKLIIRSSVDGGVRYYCYDESLMMSKFHNFYGFGIFLSATFLNHNFFSKYSNMTNVDVIEIPSTFDFAKSPIYYNNSFNMSYKKKDENILSQIEHIDTIVDKYGSGVIHTGSYFNTETLYKNTKHKDKIKVYKNTEQKKYLLEKLKREKNFFIAGPSLLEGVDLKDDISRCQIFMKIPFLSLGDNFVKIRSERNFSWYLWESALNFVQGIGRSNRSEFDYCDTYILDSTFDRLLNSKMVPEFIKERIIYE